MLELYRRATVFCLPCVVAVDGDRDGLPTSVLEAMALGVPVVTTAVNGLAEAVVHERTGLLVPGARPRRAGRRDRARCSAIRELRGRARARGARRTSRSTSRSSAASALLRSLFPEAARDADRLPLDRPGHRRTAAPRARPSTSRELTAALAASRRRGAAARRCASRPARRAPPAGVTVEVLPGPGKGARAAERLAAEPERAAWLEERLARFGADAALRAARAALRRRLGRRARGCGIPHLVELNAPLLDEAAPLPRARPPRTRPTGSKRVVLARRRRSCSPSAGRWRATRASRGARRVEVLPNAVDARALRAGRPTRAPSRRSPCSPARCAPGTASRRIAEAWACSATTRRRCSSSATGPAGELLEGVGAHVTGARAARARCRGLLAGADIGLAPYAADAPDYFSPLKLFEYLAAGLAMVAGDCRASRDVVVRRETAVLVPRGDPEALAARRAPR